MVLLLILFLLLTAYEYRRQLVKGKSKKTDEKNYSESILQKRIKRFKSIKRGYYSLIGLVLFYLLSLISPLWINNKPLMVQYKNDKYDEGEIFVDENENGVWDIDEQFEDKYEAFYPAFWELIDWIPGVTLPIYEAEYFNQNTGNFEADFKLLAKTCEDDNNGNYVIMPIYPYHPHEDLKDELDEEYIDQNQNGKYDLGEPFTDENTHFFGGKNGVWDKNNPPTPATGFDGRHIFGTDNTGRDVFARIVDGFKVSITFAIICTFLSYS